MFKGLGNLAGMLKQAQEMQGRMQEMKEELAGLQVEGSSGGGMVTVKATGKQQVTAISIDDSLLNDREMLEDLVVSAVNQALDKARDAAAEKMKSVTGGMDLPGLDDVLSKMGLS